MAQKVIVNGTVREIDGGKELINGTVRKKDHGNVLVSGTVRKIEFSGGFKVVVTGRIGGTTTVKVDGKDLAVGTYTFPAGTILVCANPYGAYLNGAFMGSPYNHNLQSNLDIYADNWSYKLELTTKP